MVANGAMRVVSGVVGVVVVLNAGAIRLLVVGVAENNALDVVSWCWGCGAVSGVGVGRFLVVAMVRFVVLVTGFFVALVVVVRLVVFLDCAARAAEPMGGGVGEVEGGGGGRVYHRV